MDVVEITLPLPASLVVPHTGRLSLLRNVVAHSPSETLCDVLIEPQSLFIRDSGVRSWVALEYMAQAVAAHAGMVARCAGEKPKIGFLLGARRMEMKTSTFSQGVLLHIRVKHLWGEGDLFSFHCGVSRAGQEEILVSAEINVFRPPNVEDFFQEEK